MTDIKEEQIGKWHCSNCVDVGRVKILEDFGYPRDYVLMSVAENEANYCLSGYYLLGIDQNY